MNYNIANESATTRRPQNQLHRNDWLEAWTDNRPTHDIFVEAMIAGTHACQLQGEDDIDSEVANVEPTT
jgi:hypothetical protein